MKILLILLLIIVSVGSASAQKVKIQADTSVDLSKYKTYAWDTSIGIGNPLIVETTMRAVDEALVAKGLRKVETGPEVTIAALTTSDSELYVANSGLANTVAGLPTGIARGSQRWPITEGTLMVAITDAQTKNSVWRAIATHMLDSGPSGNPVEDARMAEKPIRKAVQKMFKRFPRTK